MILQFFPHQRNLCEQHPINCPESWDEVWSPLQWKPYWKILSLSSRLWWQVVPFSGCELVYANDSLWAAVPHSYVSRVHRLLRPFSPLFHFHLVFEGHTWAGSPPTFSRQCPLSGREVETSRLILLWLPRGWDGFRETTEDPHRFKLSRPCCILWR